MNNILHLLGIARKAGRLEMGEEPVAAAARSGQARVILLAADAAENSARRAAHFAQRGGMVLLQVPFSKAELGGAVGRTACAMLAVTDAGLAAAVVKKLAQEDPGRYGEAAGALEQKAARVLQRQKEQRAHEKKLQRAGKKPWVRPPGTGDGGVSQGKKRREDTGKSTPPQARRAGPRGVVQIKSVRRHRTDDPGGMS